MAQVTVSGDNLHLLISSKYDAKNIVSDPNILEMIFSDANRTLDYVRVLECPFGKPEYFLGVPGLYGTRKYLISVNDDLSIGTYVEGKEYFYSMQKGIGLDIGINEQNDEFLYKALYSSRTDEVYNIFRKYIGEACEALRIADESRCFVYLFQKLMVWVCVRNISLRIIRKEFCQLLRKLKENLIYLASNYIFILRKLEQK